MSPPRSVGAGFAEHDPRIEYFVKYAPVQNFGDYLPEILCKELLTHPKIDADVFRLIGSVIEDRWARQDLRRANGIVAGLIAYWCCGARREEPLSARVREHCRFFGARGPLTRDLLGLPADTPLGDPGLLAPLFHAPSRHPATAGRTVCIPHIHDRRTARELLAMSGAETLVHPEIAASEAALREILDKIASAEFVLTASLHGAVIACAYRRPFAFWDNGHLDIPFKWRDFAASVGMAAAFVPSVAEGRAAYAGFRPGMAIPPLAAILDVCPFQARPAALARALALDGHDDGAALRTAAAALDRLRSSERSEVLDRQRDSAASRARRVRLGPRLGGAAANALRRAVRRLR